MLDYENVWMKKRFIKMKDLKDKGYKVLKRWQK